MSARACFSAYNIASVKTVNPETPRLHWPEPVNVREVWPGEAADFTPWLAQEENLARLGEVIGFGALVPLGQEVTVPGTNRSLDILAETLDGARIAIENQYGEGDHDHLTRGLAYAVGLNAGALVVIAENHRPEFIAVADHYNGLVEQVDDEAAFPIFLLNLSVKRVGEALFPDFDICARPNEWRAQAEQAAGEQYPSFEGALEAFRPAVRSRYRDIALRWADRPYGSLDWAKQSFLLRGGAGRKPPGVLQVMSTGRGYARRNVIAELTGLSDAEVDAVADQYFPGWSLGKEEWYQLGEVTPEAVEAFLGTLFPDA